ncbi:hypothetical protein HFK74_03975|uniref:hypothetical protein n=1 Tax=Pseudomonas sp. SbOxS1 TaxID=2723884 RepID=UPI0015D1E31A|nr:hypothetical protein [Pseudomonas sp. SbOxS1]NYU01856.1 hypothetical protein [Pseudomonas sp. SbOxS1]
MTLKEVMAARYGLLDGGLVPATGKISRFLALGDKPGRCTGFAVWLADGDLLLSSAHPNSTFILYGHVPVRGQSHGG